MQEKISALNLESAFTPDNLFSLLFCKKKLLDGAQLSIHTKLIPQGTIVLLMFVFLLA